MDITKTVTHIGLCAGYGGIELGLKRVLPNLRSVALCEIEAFACANLVAKMEAGLLEPAPIWSNLKTFPWGSFHGKVDVLTGGYPCQPFSAAGKRLGTEDPRHLWPFIADGIRRMQPAVCFFENVEGHISLGLREVVGELESIGYKTAWGIFSASEVGAPHQRKRIFILAHRTDTGLERYRRHVSVDGSQGREEPTRFAWPSRPGFEQFGWEPPRVVGNSNGINRSAPSEGRQHDAEVGQASERQAESSMGGDADGTSGRMDYAELCVSCDNRTDELRLLGNGVVPATAELAFRTLLKELTT